jgi:hypothetical protein
MGAGAICELRAVFRVALDAGNHEQMRVLGGRGRTDTTASTGAAITRPINARPRRPQEGKWLRALSGRR